MKEQDNLWSPQGFEELHQWFPQTPSLLLPDRHESKIFGDWWLKTTHWKDEHWRNQFPKANETTIIFVRGFLGNWMPGNLIAPLRGLQSLGFDVFLVKNHSGDLIANNVDRMHTQLKQRHLQQHLIWCGHSRGGIEALLTLAREPTWYARSSVLLSQTPHGPSPVLESQLLGQYTDSFGGWQRRWSEKCLTWGLKAIRAHRGGQELTWPAFEPILQQAEQMSSQVRVLQTASWSSRPTTWLDSFHQRLGEIRPGVAHDGQFFLEDLLWPNLPHILLPHLDHAQPAMGGFGFDPVRYWRILVAMAMD